MAHQRVRITKTTLQVRVALQKVQELFPLLSNHIQESAAMSPAGVDTSSGAMSAHSTTDDLFCHFDRTGRFVLAAAPSLTIRRGLDNRLMRISIDTTHREDLKWFGRRRSYHDFSDVEKSDFYRAVYIEALNAEKAVDQHKGALAVKPAADIGVPHPVFNMMESAGLENNSKNHHSILTEEKASESSEGSTSTSQTDQVGPQE